MIKSYTMIVKLSISGSCLTREDSWNRKWQPTPVFLPGESHEQRSVAGYSPWDRKVGHD